MSRRVIVFTGEGMGKTTAAVGMAIRASGHGMRTYMVQFIKQDKSTGEVLAAKKLSDIEIVQTGLGFLPSETDERFARHKSAAEAGLDKAAEAIASGNYSIVVLDEICFAISRGLIEEQRVIKVIETAGEDACIVLTGRGATAKVIEIADTVTQMQCIKHAMDTGRSAQKGVEM